MSSYSEILQTLQGIKKRSILGNWVSRLLSRDSQRQTVVHPCLLNGQHTLVHERGLQFKDASAYQHIVDFSKANGFAIMEDQRADFIEGIKRVENTHHANVVSIVALAATLISTNVAAKSPHGEKSAHISQDVTQSSQVEGFDLNFDSHSSQEDVSSSLLSWINNHSSFNHGISDMPEIVKVSALEMAKVAFGKDLPKAVDPEKLKIYGLYNFNERAVYILDTLDLGSEKGKGVLLHELVHFLQYQYDLDENVQCKNELESLAYLLEAKYLQSHNHRHNISMKHINRLSQCS